MAIRFRCPSGHRLSVDESRAGAKIRCPRCKKVTIVPTSGEAEAAEQRRQAKAKISPPTKDSAPKPSVPKPSVPKPSGVKPQSHRPAAKRPKLAPGDAGAKGTKPPPLPPMSTSVEPEVAEKGKSARPEDQPAKHRAGSDSRKESRHKKRLKSKDKSKSPDSKSPEPRSRSSRRKGRRDKTRSRRGGDKSTSPSEKKSKKHKGKPAEKTTPRRTNRSQQQRPKTRGPKLMPPDVYQADAGTIVSVKWLALILIGAVLFSLIPVVWKMHLNMETAPGWARLAVLIAALQVLYVCWMLAAPDWAAVWVVMVVFAAVSTLYGTASAYTVALPADRPMMFGLEEVRDTAGHWCGSVVAVMALATYLCGRASARWRRTFELETAGKARQLR